MMSDRDSTAEPHAAASGLVIADADQAECLPPNNLEVVVANPGANWGAGSCTCANAQRMACGSGRSAIARTLSGSLCR